VRAPGLAVLAVLAVLAAAALAGGGVAPRPLHAQAPDLVPVAAAYTAAWNAHDLPAVLALFAPDAVVRERRGEVPPAVWDSRDPRVVQNYLDTASDSPNSDPSNLVWVAGHPQIAAWAAARFAQQHRFAAGPYHAAGDTVGWPYREFADPWQLVPGIGPVEGEAEAVVRRGRIAVLSLVRSPASERRRWDETYAAYARAAATRLAAPAGDGPSVRLSGPPRGAPTEPAPVGWPLALGALAILGAVTAALRRRRARQR
jgi:ketosteroid isomerase-like protein